MGDILIKTLTMYGLAIAVSMLIAVVIKAIVVALNALERAPAAEQPAAVAAPAVAAAEVEAPAAHVAAIAAALCEMLGAHRILHIEDARRSAGWVAEGRLTHHVSHAVTHRPHR